MGRWLLGNALRLTHTALGLTVAGAILVLAAYGVFRDVTRDGVPQLAALAGLSVLLLARLFDRVRRPGGARAIGMRWADLELGTLFVATAYAVIELTGGPTGLLYPLVYALVAFLVAFHALPYSVYFLTVIIGTEVATNLLQPMADGWRLVASHASFNLLFGLLYALFLRSEVAQRQREMTRAIDEHMGRIATEAKDFRLTSALSLESRELSSEEIGERRRIGSVQAIHDALYNVLAVAERALNPHTVALLWMDADDRKLRVKELRSQSDDVAEQPIAAGEGFIGAITKRKEPLVMRNLKPGHTGLVYYRRPQVVSDFAGVPVMEGPHLRGVLVADRTGDAPFDESDLAVMTTLATEIVRAVQVERIFAEMDREKFQKERFYQASREFNTARTLEDVAAVAMSAARRVADAEFAAVVEATEIDGRLRIAAASWPDHKEGDALVDQTFGADEGLVGAAIKARHPLPHGTARTSSQHIFAPTCDVELAAVKVLPLLWKDQGVGALVLGSNAVDFLSLERFEMVRVIADHAAIAIANAQMYKRMEKMATTDGLTGLINHRRFQELFDAAVARVERYSRKLSVVLADIDHFKSINDTYGHPVGDAVLRRIAGVLDRSARRTDIVARYGGEEFAVLMEETDRAGALQTAERIRQAVEAELFHSEHGKFRCTLSLGVATYPEDAKQKAELIECADQALYQAKHNGRNQVVVYGSARNQRQVSFGG
ncbi:MAG: sensor domain-containing diguanylate cyclase [Myxococcota bacterium]